jgi:hypothetical protein
MAELSPELRERIAREFPPADVDAVTAILEGVGADPSLPAEIPQDLLDLADGDRAELDDAVRLARTDWRDLRLAADSDRLVRQLAATDGHGPLNSKLLGRAEMTRIWQAYLRNVPRAARFFPADRVGDVMVMMGSSFPTTAEELFDLARGDADRLGWILSGRPAGEVDPSTPLVLASLPLVAAELVRRDFPHARWEDAARVATRMPELRGLGGALEWMLVMEYAGGDVDELREAIRLQRDDYRGLSAGVARRRAEREGR